MTRESTRYISWGVLGFVLLTLAPAALSESCSQTNAVAIGWLDKMSRSAHKYSYEGVVTLQRGDDMQVIQVAHLIDGNAGSERMLQLTGQGAAVTRKAHPLDCVHPGHQLLRVSEELQAGRCSLAEQYQFRVDGAERIAGRPAVKLTVEPRDMYRYGYHLALDRETGLLLKTETFAQGGQVLERFQYANLSYSGRGPATASAETVHEAAHPHPAHEYTGRKVIRPWKVNWLPHGFTITDASVGESGRQSFTDGLAVFSVFLEKFDREMRAGEGVVREGGTVSYTRGLSLDGQPVLITVIGEVPVNTARMVADSLRWEQ